MNAKTFLLLNLALAFYNVGTIWAHEIDIFPTWRRIAPDAFHDAQHSHWRKLPYWIFAPVGLAFGAGVGLIWLRPSGYPGWAVVGALTCQVSSIILTALFWGRWQASLAKDPLGPQSPDLARILGTHWVRTLLINAYASFLLVGAIVWLW